MGLLIGFGSYLLINAFIVWRLNVYGECKEQDRTDSHNRL